MGKAFSDKDNESVFIPGKDGQGRKILRKGSDGEWSEFTTEDYVEPDEEGADEESVEDDE